jgi:hypothetical protein
MPKYTTYNGVESDIDFNDNGVMVLGSGVYRIVSKLKYIFTKPC